MSRQKQRYCKRGHLQTEENTYSRSDGYRQCKLCDKIRGKQWYFKNREKDLKDSRDWQRNNKDKKRKIDKRYLKNHPWFSSYTHAKQRCNDSKNNSYLFYGGRGIKFLMTLQDFKFLWFRDKAYLMDRPSIDRINNDGNYELSNCQFIEQSENSRNDK